MIERLHPDEIVGLPADEVDAYIERDFRIRSGLCPNGCGLMSIENGMQFCTVCPFSTNCLPEQCH